jgi:hypothetical protein
MTGVIGFGMRVNSRFLTGPLALFGMTSVVGRGGCFCGARRAAPPWGFTRRLSAGLPRLCLRLWRSPQFKVKDKINIKNVKGDGQGCLSHMGRGWEILAGVVMLAAGMGSFDCA